MADITVDQAKLVLNTFAARFQNNLIASDLFTWRKFDGEMNDRNRLTVSEQVPPRYVVTETASGVANLSSGVQDTVFGSEQYTVNRTFGASMGWADFVKVRDLGAARESEAIKSAAMQLAEKIDAYILGVAADAYNNWLGSPGEDIADFEDFVQGYTRLKELGVDDSDLRGVLTYKDKQTLAEHIIDLPAPDAMSTQSFRQGFTGQIGGIPVVFTQQLPMHTNGNDVTGLQVDGNPQNVDYADVAISAAPGQYMTQLLNIEGLTTTTGTLAKGTVFTISGVYAYDNRLGAAMDHLQQFTVLDDYTADGNGDVAARIFPAIIVPGTGVDTATQNVNTAHATCSAVPANDAPITVIGSASTAYRPRLIVQKGSLVINTVDLIMPATGKAMRKALTKVPLSVRMWQDSTFATGEHRIRFDVALTANVRDRQRGVRINGNAA